MDDYLKQALEIVKAQASVRVMAEEEITSMVRTLAAHLKTMEDAPAEQEEAASPANSPGQIHQRKVRDLP